VSFYRFPKGFYHCDHWSSSWHWMLKFPKMWCMTQCWQSIGWSLEQLPTGQAGKKVLF